MNVESARAADEHSLGCISSEYSDTESQSSNTSRLPATRPRLKNRAKQQGTNDSDNQKNSNVTPPPAQNIPPPSTVLPPPPPGPGLGPGGPPPPPPPGLHKRGNAAKPTKPLIKPVGFVKSFLWTRILVDQKSVKGGYWRDVKQLSNINFKSLEESFSAKPVVKARSSKLKSAAFVAKSNLPHKKIQAIEIFLRTSNLNVEKFLKNLYNFELDDLDVNNIKFFNDQFLTDEEYNTIADAEKKLGSRDKLLKSEQVMTTVREFPQALLRLKIVEFVLTCRAPIKSQLLVLDKAIRFLEAVHESAMIKELLSIMLTCGNFLNGNNALRCQADGFNLETLKSVARFKTTNLQSNLLEFCVDEYIAKHPHNIHTQFMNPPFPNLESYGRLSEFSCAAIESELRSMHTKLNGLKSQLAALEPKPGTNDSSEIINELSMDAQCQFSDVEDLLKVVSDKIDKAKSVVLMMVRDFGDRNIEREKSPEVMLIDIWQCFIHDLASVWKKKTSVLFEKFYRDLESVLKERRAEVKIQTRKSISGNTSSLKNRIKRMSLSSNNLNPDT